MKKRPFFLALLLLFAASAFIAEANNETETDLLMDYKQLVKFYSDVDSEARDIMDVLENTSARLTFMASDSHSVSNLELRAAQNISYGKIWVKVLSEPKKGASELRGMSIYRIIEISSQNIKHEQIESLGIRFKIRNSWVINQGHSLDDVAIYWYSGASWEKLEKEQFSKGMTFNHYFAEAPGMSDFAIVLEGADGIAHAVQNGNEEDYYPESENLTEPEEDVSLHTDEIDENGDLQVSDEDSSVHITELEETGYVSDESIGQITHAETEIPLRTSSITLGNIRVRLLYIILGISFLAFLLFLQLKFNILRLRTGIEKYKLVKISEGMLQIDSLLEKGEIKKARDIYSKIIRNYNKLPKKDREIAYEDIRLLYEKIKSHDNKAQRKN